MDSSLVRCVVVASRALAWETWLWFPLVSGFSFFDFCRFVSVSPIVALVGLKTAGSFFVDLLFGGKKSKAQHQVYK